MTKSTRTAWFVTALQFAYVIWFGVCVWVALARAAHFAGHFYFPSQGDTYTESANVWTGWSSGFIQPMMTTVMLQPLVAFASIVASTWQLAQKRTRNKRVLFWLLLISAVLVFATFVLANVPAGKSISGWILD
jgi:hypothetical protein